MMPLMIEGIECVDEIEMENEIAESLEQFKNDYGEVVLGGRFLAHSFDNCGKIQTFYDGDLNWQENFKW